MLGVLIRFVLSGMLSYLSFTTLVLCVITLYLSVFYFGVFCCVVAHLGVPVAVLICFVNSC